MNILNFRHPVATVRRGVASQPRTRRRAAGFTLIEVAVALVIFVIGALAVLRIFPPALALVQGSESRTIGTRLDKSTLATYNSQPDLVPDAVYDPNPLPRALAVVGTGSRNGSIPTGDITEANYAASALGHFQHIAGERHILRQEDIATTPPTLYTLTQYPYLAGSIYREDRVNGVRIHGPNETGYSDGELDFTNATLASDPNVPFSTLGTHRPPVDMSVTDVTYYISYSWQEAGQLQSVIDEPMQITTASSLQSLQGSRFGASPSTGTGVLPGSISVRFRYRIGAINFPSNDNMRGYAALRPNPNETTATTFPNLLKAGDTVSVDYDVVDWRWLVQDNDPSAYNLDQSSPFADPAAPPPNPNGNSRTINLPIHPLNDVATTWLYSLVIAADSGTAASGIKLFRAQWDTTTSSGPSTTDSGTLQWADRKSGQVMYDMTAATANTVTHNFYSPRVRTVYQTLDGWAHQLSVAARSYVPYYVDPSTHTSTHIDEGWRQYVWGGPESPGSGLTAPPPANILYFHPSEAGKSILVSYRYNDGGKIRDVSTILTISDNVGGVPGYTPAFDPYGTATAELTTLDGKTLNPAYVESILSVQGADVRARTAWIDGTRYTQAAVAGYRNASQLQTNS